MENVEQVVAQLQMHNQILQTIAMQRQSLMIQQKEIESALNTVDTCDSDVYKSVGPILVKSDKETIKKELEEQKEEIELKLKSFDGQEKKLKEKMKDMQEKLQDMMPAGQGG
jgi:prefoldin beta subunit